MTEFADMSDTVLMTVARTRNPADMAHVLAERLEAALATLRSMEAKPDPEGDEDALDKQVQDLWMRRHSLTQAEWLEAAPVLLGLVVARRAAKPEPTRTELGEALNMRLLLDTAIKHKLETHTHGGLTEFGEGGLAALQSLEREFDLLSRKQSGGGSTNE